MRRLRSTPQRTVTLDGQRFDPDDPEARLYATFFCRNCGQEHHPVVLVEEGGIKRVLPRDIDETPLDDPDSTEKPGYLMPEPENDDDYSFTGAPTDYPEEWLELSRDGSTRLRSNRRPHAAQELTVDADRHRRHHRTPGVVPARQVSLLPGLRRSTGGAGPRDQQAGEPVGRRPQLRDDTAGVERIALDECQRAHCRPYDASCLASPTIARMPRSRPAISTISCSSRCLRAATLAAVRAAGPDGLTEDEFGRRLQAALGFTAANRERRQEWMLDPEIKGVGQVEAERTLARVLAHRAWVDQRRGWRFTNPNLEELGLVRADYVSLDDLAADDGAFANAPPELRTASPDARRRSAPDFVGPPAPGSCDHDRCSRPVECRSAWQCVAPELARAVVDLAAGDPRALQRHSSSMLRTAPTPDCAASR